VIWIWLKNICVTVMLRVLSKELTWLHLAAPTISPASPWSNTVGTVFAKAHFCVTHIMVMPSSANWTITPVLSLISSGSSADGKVHQTDMMQAAYKTASDRHTFAVDHPDKLTQKGINAWLAILTRSSVHACHSSAHFFFRCFTNPNWWLALGFSRIDKCGNRF